MKISTSATQSGNDYFFFFFLRLVRESPNYNLARIWIHLIIILVFFCFIIFFITMVFYNIIIFSFAKVKFYLFPSYLLINSLLLKGTTSHWWNLSCQPERIHRVAVQETQYLWCPCHWNCKCKSWEAEHVSLTLAVNVFSLTWDPATPGWVCSWVCSACALVPTTPNTLMPILAQGWQKGFPIFFFFL